MNNSSTSSRLFVPIHKSARAAVAAIMAFLTLLVCGSTAASSHDKRFTESYNFLKNKTVKQLDSLGGRYKQRGDMDKALLCYTIITGKYNGDVPAKEQAVYSNAYNDIGIIYFTKANYSEAFEAFTKAAELADSALLPRIYNNIASLYYYFNDYGNTLAYLEKAYTGCIRQHDMTCLYNVVRNSIEIGFATGRLEESTRMLRQYRKMTGNSKSPEEIFTRTLCQGAECVIGKQYAEAVSFFRQAQAYTGKIWLGKPQEVTVNSYIAKAYAMAGDTARAITCLQNCEAEARAGGMNDMLMDAYKQLGRIYKETGDTRNAGAYRMKYLELKDSIFSIQELGRMKDFRFNNEVAKYKHRVDSLNAANERSSIMVASVSGGLFAVSVLLLWMYRQYRIMKRKNAALYGKNVELLKAENEEREYRKAFVRKTDALQQRIRELESLAADKDSIDGGKYCSSNLNEDSKNILVERIRQVFDTPEVFCNSDFSLEKLSEKVGSNVKYVSQTINETIGTNFNTLLNNHRVKEACRRLADFDRYGGMTLEAVAQSVGFKSRSHFCRIFKSTTGLTPSGFQSMAREQASNAKG